VVVETPFATDKEFASQGFFLLSKEKVDLCAFLRYTFFGWLQVDSVTVTLVLAVNVHNDG
jgi:hypothetical protein